MKLNMVVPFLISVRYGQMEALRLNPGLYSMNNRREDLVRKAILWSPHMHPCAQHNTCTAVVSYFIIIIFVVVVAVIQLDTYYVQLETRNYSWRIVFIRLACGHVCENVMWGNLLD